MNRWRCDEPGCKTEAVGVGGAIGLLAIGWTFRSGGPLLCPIHSPEVVGCIEQREAPPCRPCSSSVRAERFQLMIGAAVGEPDCVRTIVEVGRYWPTVRPLWRD